MSPLPLRTSTDTFHVGGSPASAIAAGGLLAPRTRPGRTNAPAAATRTTKPTSMPVACRIRSRPGPGDDRKPRKPSRLAAADAEPRRVEEKREQRTVARGEAVEPALFEPGHFVGSEPRELGRALHGQLAAHARSRERRRLAVGFEGGDCFHERIHSSGGGLNLSGKLIGKIDVSWRAEVVAGDEERREAARPFVRNPLPDWPCEHDRMAAVCPHTSRPRPLRRSPATPPGHGRSPPEPGRDRRRGRRAQRRFPERERPAHNAATRRALAPSRGSARLAPRSRGSCAPSTTTISSTELWRTCSSTGSRSTRCFALAKAPRGPSGQDDCGEPSCSLGDVARGGSRSAT